MFCKCLTCGDFLTISDYKEKHDFLKHDEREDDLFEDKPIDVEKTVNLLKFEITVNKYGEYYNFENSEKVVDDFLKNIRSRFKSCRLKLIKCSFVVENIQQSVFENLTPILNMRY